MENEGLPYETTTLAAAVQKALPMMGRTGLLCVTITQTLVVEALRFWGRNNSEI